MSPRLRALRCLSDHLQQPHGPEFAVSGDELYTWLRAYLTQAGHRQRPDYAYEANRLYSVIADNYRQAGNYIATDQGQDFFDVAALRDAVRRTSRRHNSRRLLSTVRRRSRQEGMAHPVCMLAYSGETWHDGK